MGWWPINFPGFDDPPYRENWHIEGGWFHHHVWSPEQALLNLFCFSTVDPGGGGTLLVEGSHHLAARILWEAEPEGLEADEFGEPLNAILDQKGWPGVVEVVAEGDDLYRLRFLWPDAPLADRLTEEANQSLGDFCETPNPQVKGHIL